MSKTAALSTVVGLAAAWLAFTLLVWAYGEAPRELAADLAAGTWGSAYGVGQVLFKATPILFTGVAFDLALRAGLFNIGAEGQLAVASLAVASVGAALPRGTPWPLALPIVVVVAFVTGAIWAAPPALLRARFGAHEVISTIMMNRIADACVGLALMRGLALADTMRTPEVIPSARMARLDGLSRGLHGSAASVALFIAIAVAVLAWAWLARTRIGREIVLVGMAPAACEAEHIPVRRRLAQALVVSGGVAGLASLATVLGYKGYYETGLGAGAGFGGLAVALLGRGHPVGLLLAALLFGTLAQGGLAINGRVPMEVMDVLQGVVIAAVALSDARVRRAIGVRVRLA